MSELSFQDIETWLDQLSGASEAPTPSSSTLPSPFSTTSGYRQKRRASMASERNSSPSKRPRIADDRSITSEISLHSSITTLRQVTPTRDILNQLRLADPSVVCGPLALSPTPESAIALRKCLTDGFGHNIIPRKLESRIRAYDPYSADEIPQTAFSDSSTLSDTVLEELWSGLKTICFDARQCDIYGKDENAWCLDVVQPILNSSIKGCQLLQLISVQSQHIDHSLLPKSKSGLSKISKKADYTLSFTCRHDLVRSFCDKISLGGHGYQLSQTTDAFTKRILLFSGMEVKSDEGSKKEALAQLAIWLAAGLEEIRRLGEQVMGESEGSVDWLLPSIGITIIGHDWYTYLAYKIGNEVHVVGPVSAIITDTRTIYGILKVHDLVRRVAEYAIQVYWPWIRDEILQPLAA